MITNIITAIVTAYVATGHLTANGHVPAIQHTIAVPRTIPFGSKIIIDNQIYIAEDRMNKRFPNRFDIFMSNNNDALTWGKQTKKVTIIHDCIGFNTTDYSDR